MTTCFEAFKETADKFPGNDFLHIPAEATKSYSPTAIDFRYEQALTQILSLRNLYQGAGYGCGTRAALLLDNRAEFFFHFLALNALGASIVPIHPDLSPEEKSHLLSHSEAVFLVTVDEFKDTCDAVCDTINRSIPVVTHARMADLPHNPNPAAPITPGSETEAAILYTSGTTGTPKGCVLTNHYFLSWGRWYNALGGMATLQPGQERLITPLPLNHQNALACSFMGMVMVGGCVIQLDRFHSSSWWASVRSSRATIIHYLGVMPAMLLNKPVEADEDFSEQIKFGLGAGVDPKHHASFEARFGFPLLEGWAMTETGSTVCLMTTNEPRHVGERCLGRASATMDYRVVDEAGNDVPLGESGELLVRSKGANPRKAFFREYLKDEAATAEAWEGDYFHTGDVVRVSDTGYFHFVDRRKNVIRRSGENIAAIEIEAALLPHASVSACAVTAVDDEFRGEEVMALIQLADGSPGDRELAMSIQNFCMDRLVYYKAPGHVVFVDTLPVGSTQKIKRGEIKTLRDAVLGSPDHYDLTGLKKRRKGI